MLPNAGACSASSSAVGHAAVEAVAVARSASASDGWHAAEPVEPLVLTVVMPGQCSLASAGAYCASASAVGHTVEPVEPVVVTVVKPGTCLLASAGASSASASAVGHAAVEAVALAEDRPVVEPGPCSLASAG